MTTQCTGGDRPPCTLREVLPGGHRHGGCLPDMGSALGIFLDAMLGGRTYLWFCAWISHMVLVMIAYSPCYFVDPVKGTMVMF